MMNAFRLTRAAAKLPRRRLMSTWKSAYAESSASRHSYGSGYGMSKARTMSSMQKGMIALGGGCSLAGLGTVYYMNSMYSETAQASDTRRALGLPWPDHVRERVNATWMYIGSGLGISTVAAMGAVRSGLAHRMVAMNPWLRIGLSLGCVMIPMIGAQTLSDPLAKMACFGIATTMVGVTLSPFGFLGQHIVVKAAMGTAAVMGSLSIAAMSAPSESMLWMSGPLSIGLGVVFAASMGGMFFPASPFLHTVSMYGGLALFGGFALYDTQKMIYKAEHMQVYDPLAESFSLYLDTINIFIRLAYMFASGKKK